MPMAMVRLFLPKLKHSFSWLWIRVSRMSSSTVLPLATKPQENSLTSFARFPTCSSRPLLSAVKHLDEKKSYVLTSGSS